MPYYENIMNKQILQSIVFDTSTGLPIAEDSRGDWHVLKWEELVNTPNSPRVYLQTDIYGQTWGNTTSYQTIKNTFTGATKLFYTVPPGKIYHLAFIMASKYGRPSTSNSGNNKDKDKDKTVIPNDGISSIGFFVNGIFLAHIPFKNELHYVLFSPIAIKAGGVLEFRLRPFTKELDFGFIAGGYLVEHE